MRCPICNNPVPDPKNEEPLPAYYPFCSDRCRLVDLNRWLTGRYQIPVDPSEEPPIERDDQNMLR